jgi:hypothetical protein
MKLSDSLSLSIPSLDTIRERCNSTIDETSSAAPQRASGDGSGTPTNQTPGPPEAVRETGGTELPSPATELYEMLVAVEVMSSEYKEEAVV